MIYKIQVLHVQPYLTKTVWPKSNFNSFMVDRWYSLNYKKSLTPLHGIKQFQGVERVLISSFKLKFNRSKSLCLLLLRVDKFSNWRVYIATWLHTSCNDRASSTKHNPFWFLLRNNSNWLFKDCLPFQEVYIPFLM